MIGIGMGFGLVIISWLVIFNKLNSLGFVYLWKIKYGIICL